MKVNCKRCLDGEHSQCQDVECLCLENNHGIDIRVEEEKTYTDSAMCDLFKIEISLDKEYSNLIYGLRMIPNATLNFDPTRFPKILDLYLKNDVRTKVAIRRAVLEIIQSAGADISKFDKLKIRFIDSVPIKMKDWNSNHKNTPMATEAIIIHIAKAQTYVIKARSRCPGCYTERKLEVDPWTNKIQPPPKCDVEGCRSIGNRTHVLVDEMEIGDCKDITIQEPMDESQHGSPVTLQARVYDDEIKDIYIGQRQKIVGIFTVNLDRKEAIQDTLIKVITLTPVNENTLDKITDEDIKEIKKFVSKDDFLDILIGSIAPEIYGEQLPKLCGIVGLVGGVKEGRLRGIVNTLLVGDPSTGKSKILEFLSMLLSKSSFIDASMASGPGITIAYDDKLKGPRVGPIPLCDGGAAIIDELTRMTKHDTPYLLQIMESGKLKFTKAGFDIELNANTAIIAGANPKNHYYDKNLSIVDNINLIEPIISRFDLIVNMQTTIDEHITQKKLEHIDKVRQNGVASLITTNKLLSIQFLKKYFSYIRKIEPKMSKEATDIRQKFFLRIQKIQQEKGSRPIDIRFYESLYRIAQAIARIHLSEIVTEKHMDKAIQIQSNALKTFGMTISEGETQLNMVESSTSKEAAFKHVWKLLVDENDYSDKNLLLEEDVIKNLTILANDHFKNNDASEKYFAKMDREDVILKKNGRYFIE